MQTTPTTTLSRATLMFPLALVLFEFSVYIGNDLVQPAMLAITQDFGVSSSWAASSMSFYLLGGACVAAILGPLSDRLGRKKVLLGGVLFFVVTCLLILLTQNIESFLLLRFLQGFGLSVITAVGYAAIQESFAERDAIKVMALMANVSLLAPLLGPVLGAFMIEHVSWHWGFIGIAALAAVSWLGLKAKMPEQQLSIPKQPIGYIWDDFKQVLKNRRFLTMTFALPLLSMPLMLWIALSPVMLVEQGWVLDGVLSQSLDQVESLWRLREDISESIAPFIPYKNDISVLITHVPAFIKEIDAIVAENYPDFEICWFGHIGDGNLHLNILKPADLSKDEFFAKCQVVNKYVFDTVKKYDGSISAEHGVGMTKKPYLEYSRSAEEIEYMKALKQVFDPNGIMNPGKLFDL